MSEKIERRVTYTLFAFIIVASFLGMGYSLMHPEMYTEMMIPGNIIPMVQHHIDIEDCFQVKYAIFDTSVEVLSCENIVV